MDRCEREHTAARAAREGAEAALASARAVTAEREAEHAQAQREAREPGYAPRSRETIAADLVWQAAGGSGPLGQVDKMAAALVARAVLAAASPGVDPLRAAAEAAAAGEPERAPDGRLIGWAHGRPVVTTGGVTGHEAAEALIARGGEVLPDRSMADVRERMLQDFWQGSDPADLAAQRQAEALHQHITAAGGRA